MLKQIILEYVDSINALRDFVDSIKLRLEEHVNRVLNVIEEPYLTDRLEKLQKTSEKSQMYGQLNYWQSVKWQGRFEDVRKEVERADFSAKDPLYQLALLALDNKNERFFSLLPVVPRSEKLTLKDLKAWPIFREMREDPTYPSFLPKTPPEGAAQDATPSEAIH